MSLLIPAMQRKRANQKTPTVAGFDRVFGGDFGGKLSEVPGFSLRERDQRNRTLYPLDMTMGYPYFQ